MRVCLFYSRNHEKSNTLHPNTPWRTCLGWHNNKTDPSPFLSLMYLQIFITVKYWLVLFSFTYRSYPKGAPSERSSVMGVFHSTNIPLLTELNKLIILTVSGESLAFCAFLSRRDSPKESFGPSEQSRVSA